MAFTLGKALFDVKCRAEDFGLVFMCHFIWFGVNQALFPKLPWSSSTHKAGITESPRSPWHKSKTSSDEMLIEELKTLDYFWCLCAWFGVFGPSLPKLPKYPSTHEIGITQPTDSLDTRVRPHLTWNKDLKNLDSFSCVSSHDLGCSGPVSLNCPQYPSTCDTGTVLPTEGPDTRLRSHLMWDKELKTLDYFSCVPAHDLGHLGPVSPHCPNN